MRNILNEVLKQGAKIGSETKFLASTAVTVHTSFLFNKNEFNQNKI